MDKSNEIVVNLTDKYQTSIQKMDNIVLGDYLKSLKTHLRDDTNTFNRVAFMYALKDLTNDKYVELLISTEHDKSKVVHYNKPKLDIKTGEIINIDMVHYDLYQDDMKLSDMIREKGFLVTSNVSDKDTTENLILKINAQNQQIDSIINGIEEIKPIQTHHKEYLKSVKDRSISDRYAHLNKIDKNIALLRYKIAFVVLETSKRVHDKRDSILMSLNEIKSKYNFTSKVVSECVASDLKETIPTRIKGGMEEHKHVGAHGWHKVSITHKNKQLHEGINNISTIGTEFK